MKLCKHCGDTEENHHAFEAQAETKCVCIPFGVIVPPICVEYNGDGQQYCRTCAHKRECHK